jgi:hypothetical protein
MTAFVERVAVVSIAGVDRFLFPIQGGRPDPPKKPQRFPVAPSAEQIARTKAKDVVLPVDVLDALADLLADALVESYKEDRRQAQEQGTQFLVHQARKEKST